MVTISFIKFHNSKWWAFKQMQLLPPQIAKVKGVVFSKFLGTGSGFGFSLIPDLNTYALLIKWNSEEEKEDFYSNNSLFMEIQERSLSINTFSLRSITSHGGWYGQNPFNESSEYEGGKLAVITRARINPLKLPSFWKNVPKASRAIQAAKGLNFTKGIGEWPLIEQATFSIWENQQAMMDYAYQDTHKEIIKKVKNQNWYKEELFARFNLLEDNLH